MGPEDVVRACAARGLEVRVARFPEGTRTAAAAARALGCDVAQIVKALVFVADGAPVLACVSGANRADEARLAEALGAASVRKATADEVRAWTGFSIGGVPPAGHAQSLRCVIDEDLLAHEIVWAAAGAPDAVFPLTPQALAELTGGRVARLAP